jgi:YgiT-type zinc finger domain-containing protein
MICHACHNQMKQVTKAPPWETDRGWVMIHAVRHWECPVCSEQVFDRNATKEILE